MKILSWSWCLFLLSFLVMQLNEMKECGRNSELCFHKKNASLKVIFYVLSDNVNGCAIIMQIHTVSVPDSTLLKLCISLHYFNGRAKIQKVSSQDNYSNMDDTDNDKQWKCCRSGCALISRWLLVIYFLCCTFISSMIYGTMKLDCSDRSS